MGKTKRHIPKDGEFKKLKTNNRKRKRQSNKNKAELSRFVSFSNHEYEPNEETIAAMEEENLPEFDSVKELFEDLDK